MINTMRKKLLLAIAFSLGIWAYVLLLVANPRSSGATLAPSTPANPDEGIIALFSPSGGCTEAIIAAMAKATQSIDIQAYSFSATPIAQAVVDAHERGVKVRVLLDKAQRGDRNSCANFLQSHKVPLYIDDQHAIAHNKVVLIDGKVVITGSFNFTKSSEERNAENLLILQGRPKLFSAYQSNFDHHFEHSVPFSGNVKTLSALTAPKG